MKKNKIYLLILSTILLVLVSFYFIKTGNDSFVSSRKGVASGMASLYIYGEDDDFWSDETGILVGGRQLREYKQKLIDDGDVEASDIDDIPSKETMPANYNNKDWVKSCKVILEDSEGNTLLEENVGLRISGNASRKLHQKSFMLIADKNKYNSNENKFYLDMNRMNLEEESISRYKKLRVHTNGQDLRNTQMRDEIISDLAKKCGILPVRWQYPCFVYINDKFYGIAHLENPISDEYIASYYGLDKDSIEVVEGGIAAVTKAMGYDYKTALDFSLEENRVKLESQMDVDNFISYYAFNMLINNCDWPYNNVLCWRYTGKSIDGRLETDGRYRFVVTDIDASFQDFSDDCFDQLNYNGATEYYIFMESLLKADDYREKFVNAIMDQLTMGFDESTILEIIQNVSEKYGDAFKIAAQMVDDDVLREYLEGHDDSLNQLTQIAVSRKQKIYDYLYNYYDAGEGYVLRVLPNSDGTIYISSIPVNIETGEVSSVRSMGCSVEISYDGAGEHFWVVNGTRRNEAAEELKICSDDVIDGTVEITLE